MFDSEVPIVTVDSPRSLHNLTLASLTCVVVSPLLVLSNALLINKSAVSLLVPPISINPVK